MDKVLRRKTPAAHKWQTSCNSEINIKKNVPWHILASLATIYIFARVRIFGTLVPFYVTENSSEFPVT